MLLMLMCVFERLERLGLWIDGGFVGDREGDRWYWDGYGENA